MSDPVKLDMLQSVIEVGWKTRKYWRVDYSYRSNKRAASEFYDAVYLIYDPVDPSGPTPNPVEQTYSHFLNAANFWGSPWLAGEFEQVTVRTETLRNGYYIYLSGVRFTSWDRGPENPGEYAITEIKNFAWRPERIGFLIERDRDFTTNSKAEEDNLAAEIAGWWGAFQADLHANGNDQAYGDFVISAPYRIDDFGNPI